MEELKLYEYGIEKPDLSELYLEHLGIDYSDCLKHFNKNHDPRNGQFTFGPGGRSGSITKKKKSGGLIQRYKAKKAYKRRVESVNKARQAKQAKAEAAKRAQEEQDSRERAALEKEMWRQDVINRGDAKAASEHTDDFSKEEIERIIGKYQANQRLSQLVSETNAPMNPPPNTTEVQKSRWEKMGNKISEINKFAGPMSELARNASSMYDLYSKVSKDKQAKDNEQYKRQKEAEETNYKRRMEREAVEYRKQQDALDRKERYDLHITKEEQNKAKAQQNNQQNQPKQQQNQPNNQPKQQNNQQKSNKIDNSKNKQQTQPKLTSDQEKAITYLNNKSLDAEAMGKKDQTKVYDKEIVAIAKGEKSASPYLKEASKPYKIDFNTEGWSKKTTIRTEKAANRVKKASTNASESMKKSISNLATNPNTKGALAQLTRDLTKNTKTTSGQQVHLRNNGEWLASQSTDVLKLMKKNIERGKDNPSAMGTLKDINSILKKRGARSPLQ